MAEDKTLAGFPKKSLVRQVRSILWNYLRCRPQKDDRLWRMAWQWAAACKDVRVTGKKVTRVRTTWPTPSEIASQYLLLALAEMRGCYTLRLPMKAAELAPQSIVNHFEEFRRPTDKPMLGGGAAPALGFEPAGAPNVQEVQKAATG